MPRPRGRSLPRSRPAGTDPDPDQQGPQALDTGRQDPQPLEDTSTLQGYFYAKLVNDAMQQVEPFHGKPAAKVAEFLDQLRHAFKVSPLGSKSDEEKVAFAISRLRDTAFEWVQAYRSKDPRPEWLGDFDSFAEEIASRFGKPTSSLNASVHLRVLKQTGSVANYATEFLQAAAALNWPDPPLMDAFYHGLKDAVKDELVKAPEPTDLESFIRLASRIDSRLQERAVERTRAWRATHPPPTYPRAPATAAAQDPGPRPQGRSSGQPRPRLTEAERELRRKNNLCLYCGSPDHLIRECPLCPHDRPRPAHIAEAALAPDEPQENAPAQLQ
jgi:hypothetical protein